MPIKIPLKQAGSNKPHIPPKSATAGSSDHPTHPLDKQYLSPFIDWLTINVSPPDGDQHDIYNAFWTAVDDAELFADATAAEKKAFGTGFNVAKRLVLPSIETEKKRPSLFVRHLVTTKRIAKLRLNFVPVDLGVAGMMELHAAINTIVPDGWEYVAKHGRITRIDVAVDLPDLTMDSIHFLPKKPAHMLQLSPGGEIETIYFGKPKSNQIAIYDRAKKRAKLGQEMPQCLRIERKLKPGGMKLTSLPAMGNPFADTKFLIALPGPPNPAKEKEWTLFSDSVEKRGLAAALALLPKDRRTAYKKHLSANALPAWKPEEIWAGWVPMIEELKIASAHW